MTTILEVRSPVKPSRERKKPTRTIRLLSFLPESRSGLFRVTEGKDVALYHFAEAPADFGRAFLVEKATPGGTAILERYHVNVGGEGEPPTCPCKGHSRFGYCRHVSGLLKLIEEGKLPGKGEDVQPAAPVEPANPSAAPRICRVCRLRPLGPGLGTCPACAGW
jgi:hypothetical protein